MPWLCAGDFNDILHAIEQFSGNQREELMMDGFRSVVDDCGLCDLGYTGLPFTWDNRQSDTNNVKVCLDKAVGHTRFMQMFGATSVSHIPVVESNHCGLLIELKKTEVLTMGG